MNRDRIYKIEFQIEEQIVLMTLFMEKNNKFALLNYEVSQSDINKIIGKIQIENPFCDIFKKINIKHLNNRTTLCTLILDEVDFNFFALQNDFFYNQNRKIRA